MSKNIIIKITICTLFCLLLISCNKVFAFDINEVLERGFDKVETEEGTFYKSKKFENSHTYVGYPSSFYKSEDEEQYNKLNNILKTKVEKYMEKYTSDECPEDQKIADKFYVEMNSLYSFEKAFDDYSNSRDISLLAVVSAEPINGNSNYWKENFSNNELYYNEQENKYSVIMNYFVRLSKSSETGEYEIAYIDLKPENYDNYIAEFKETKGVDLENLDIEKILNTDYGDEIKPVASSNTVAFGADKKEYDSAQIKEISNISVVIRVICTLILSAFIILYIIRKIVIRHKNNI